MIELLIQLLELFYMLNPPIEEAIFDVKPLITQIGINNISITSNNFYLITINKIIIKDNDGNSVIFLPNTFSQEVNYFTFSDSKDENRITLSFVAHP